jgi:NlpC/P60 family putative phage cell wall peptidase
VARPAERSAPIARQAIVAAARSWIGTPYVHRQSVKGAGCDCLGLVRGVWREVLGAEPEALPAYAAGWAEATGREEMLEAARRHLVEIDRARFDAGDVLLFRWRPDLPARHAAIATGPASIVHAYQGHAVAEVALPRAWRRRIAAAFAFPGAA